MNIITGDDIEIITTLMIDGATFSISGAAIIKAAIIDKNNTALLVRPVLVLEASLGSNWATSLIVIKIPGKATSGIPLTTLAQLEVQVDDGGKKRSWISDIKITKGLI